MRGKQERVAHQLRIAAVLPPPLDCGRDYTRESAILCTRVTSMCLVPIFAHLPPCPRGIPRVEAGAQGMHKLQRGYLPSFTYSSHYIVDERLRGIVGRFLASELQRICQDMQVGDYARLRASKSLFYPSIGLTLSSLASHGLVCIVIKSAHRHLYLWMFHHHHDTRFPEPLSEPVTGGVAVQGWSDNGSSRAEGQGTYQCLARAVACLLPLDQ